MSAPPRRLLPLLCITQVVSWGTLYYSLPAVAADIVSDTGWSLVSVMGAFSAGLVLSAVVGIAAGRLLDRFGGRVVMLTGSLLALIGVLLLATASSFAGFVVAWLVIGIAQAGILYQPAFTLIGLHYQAARDRPLLILTLVAGLASTIYVPIASLLAGELGWRDTYLVLGAALALITIPLHALLPNIVTRPVPSIQPAGRSRIIFTFPFLGLAAGLALLAFAMFGVTLNLIPLLAERGINATTAAILLAAVGAGQVIGRIIFTILNRWMPARWRATGVGVAAVVVLGALALIPGPVGLLAAVAAVSGAVRGALTLVQATAVADRWGLQRLGALNGALAAPVTAASALAPVSGVAIAAGLGSFPMAVVLLAGVAALGTLFITLALAGHRPKSCESPLMPEEKGGRISASALHRDAPIAGECIEPGLPRHCGAT
ncbi:MFS transporter [Naasia lichenicola]|uniref:MFS transporter n=1 Tax=Naasia lichenicola TaxID=2565933 RepID=A0A4S4FNE9_9MICO|nr:MFS transporter [Naasia lichenicola]THG31015.1 MFS transporter [Naasia lichenicola]